MINNESLLFIYSELLIKRHENAIFYVTKILTKKKIKKESNTLRKVREMSKSLLALIFVIGLALSGLFISR
jgi:hypothetical protein